MEINGKEIGKRIRTERKRNGLTQAKLAERLGISLNTIGRIEVGIRMPSIELFVELAELFEVSLDYLILGKK